MLADNSRDLTLYLIGLFASSLTLLILHGPAVVLNGILFQHATPSSFVSKSTATSVHGLLFFSTGSGVLGYPSKVINSPTAAPSGGARGSHTFGPPSGSCEAHNTMPCESIPASFAVFRLQMHTTRRPCIDSSDTSPPSPDRICLGPLSSPTSMVSTKSFSDSGCITASFTIPCAPCTSLIPSDALDAATTPSYIVSVLDLK